MNWKPMDEMKQKNIKSSVWSRYRKWLMIPCIILAGFLIFQGESLMELLWYGHVCELPRPGNDQTIRQRAYDYGIPLPEEIQYILDEDEKVPYNGHQMVARQNERNRSYEQRWYEEKYTLVDESWGQEASLYCEVECVHVVDTVSKNFVITSADFRGAYSLAEYRVIRVLAEQPSVKGRVKEGDLIATMEKGTSRLRYYGNEPYQKGDRMIIAIMPLDQAEPGKIAQEFAYHSEFYIYDRINLCIDESSGEYTTEKPVRITQRSEDGTVKIVGEMDPDRPVVDQLGELMQQKLASFYGHE